MPQKNDVILSINQEAQEKIKQGIDVTNGSIGMMYLDDGHLPVSTQVRQALARHTEDNDLSYPSVAGGKDFQEAVRHWFLASAFDNAEKEGRYASLGTPGGTGAVCLAFFLAKKRQATLLIPSLGWPNYEGIAKGFGLAFDHYNLFSENHFDLSGLAESLTTALRSSSRVALLVNDPCQNPTGYSLDETEWMGLTKLLSQAGFANKVDLVIDAAYIDFAAKSDREGMLKALSLLPPSMLVCFCFSFSKTFSFYGLRIGALALYFAQKDLIAEQYDIAVMEARALWSVPNHMAMNVVSELCSNPTSFAALKSEVEENRRLVAARAALFLEEAARAHLAAFPYRSGFFITLPMKDAFAVALKLKEKNIYLAPIRSDALRIALCALPLKKLAGLAAKIVEAQKECA